MPANPRFKCRSCRRYTIRRGTHRTRLVAYCPSLAKICLDCAIAAGYLVGQLSERDRPRGPRGRRRAADA